MEMLSSKQKTAIIIAGVIVVGIFIIYMATKTKDYDNYSVINEEIEENTNENKEEIQSKMKEYADYMVRIPVRTPLYLQDDIKS